MSDSRDDAAIFHDRHDPMLVAALAAGDLAGPERDQAIALIDSCTECATLHADLQAIVRATATVAPPFTAPQRDFRLSAAQAASLRRTGWRRFVPAGAARSPLTRPVGVALATFGLAGLLIGTIPLNLGSASAGAAPVAAPDTRESVTSNGAGAGRDSSVGGQALGGAIASAAASQAAAPALPAPAPAASVVAGAASPGAEVLQPVASAAPGDFGTAKGPSSAAAGGQTTDQVPSAGGQPPVSSSSLSGPSTLVIVSIVAILLGAVLIVVGRRRVDRSA